MGDAPKFSADDSVFCVPCVTTSIVPQGWQVHVDVLVQKGRGQMCHGDLKQMEEMLCAAKILACPLTRLESERIQQLHFSLALSFASGNVL